VELRVLGPVEVVGGRGTLRLQGGKQRRLLAALAVRAGETVLTDSLTDAVWSEAPPRSAAKLVQVYVSQLRKLLVEGARIETRGGGYALVLGRDSLDAARFERLLAEGTTLLGEANAALAISLFERALSLWRGPAYGELAYEEFARAEAERLGELRTVAVEERFEAGLALGRHVELLPELRAAVAAQPMRERLYAQTMLALYRCGRQTEALELYATVRRRLRDELGLEPGNELRALQRRILRHDASLDIVRPEQAWRVELPAPVNPLLGRERELAELSELLARDDVRLLVLTGAGGSGKTRLALELAREVTDSFANGAAFVELAPLRDPALLLDTILRPLPVDCIAEEEQLETLMRFLAPRELLLVLDNAEHLHDAMVIIRELLARAPRLTVLVTSRAVLHLSGEHVYPVQPLAEDAAFALFAARAQQAGTRLEPDASDEQAIRAICARLDCLPLAIELAAARAPSLAPPELLARPDPRLPLLTGGPRDLPARQQTLLATLQWSFDLLSKESANWRRGSPCSSAALTSRRRRPSATPTWTASARWRRKACCSRPPTAPSSISRRSESTHSRSFKSGRTPTTSAVGTSATSSRSPSAPT
jgi:DNA-binding SARP family transcriptional activator